MLIAKYICSNYRSLAIYSESEIEGLPSLIRCESCRANQGAVPQVEQLSLFGGAK
jgi:hypothetical protein